MLLVLISLSLVLSSPLFASWTGIASTDFEMSEPPERGSAEDKNDFKELHRLENTREESQCELASTQLAPTYEAFFGPSSEQLTHSEYSKARPLMEKVFKTANRIATYFKNQFHRERPYNVDTSLSPCITPPKGAKSYPSSHAALATVGGCVLAKLFPMKAKSLNDYGDYLGRLRVIVGVHHPSDVKAGQRLGKQICERLLSEDDFLEELGQ